MNIRAIPRTAVKTSIRLARLPFDAAVQLLPGNGAGAKGTAMQELMQCRDGADVCCPDHRCCEKWIERRPPTWTSFPL